MSEWKNYGETTFTDFGSIGETQPVDASDMGGLGGIGETMPEGFAGNFDMEKTEPDAGSDSGWTSTTGDFNVKTVPVFKGFENAAGATIRPATGWLVCIEGKTKGQDYRLYDGYTYIGRGSEHNQVVIPDPKISSVPSARILYDNETRSFHINECDGATNPVYLNGKLFDHRVELAAYDIIKLGDTKLMFVPLCTPKFSWEE